MAEVGGLVTDELGVAGNEASVVGQRQRIDFEKLQILLAGDVRQARRVTGKPGGQIAWEQFG